MNSSPVRRSCGSRNPVTQTFLIRPARFAAKTISVACLIFLLAGCGDEQSAQTGNPVQVATGADPGGLNDGKTLYELYCMACHGQGPGHPGTMRLQERVGAEQAALLDRDNLPPEYIKLVVREGFKLMPPFRPSEITDRQLDELAAYISGEVD